MTILCGTSWFNLGRNNKIYKATFRLFNTIYFDKAKRYHLKQLLFIITVFLFSFYAHAQPLSNTHIQEMVITSDTMQLDSLSVIPQSVSIFNNNALVNDSLYTIDYANGLLITDQFLNGEKIRIHYRTFTFSFTEPTFNRDYHDYNFATLEKMPAAYQQGLSGQMDLFAGDQIDRRGNISRGISFGNNQNAAVNSNLNLQLNGKLSEDIYIKAALSDNNIPIQPDGYSQQIQEIDKVFIELYNDKTNLTVGDYTLAKPTGHFMHFNKKLLGADVQHQFFLDKDTTTVLNSKVSAAISKGQYNRYSFNGTEGNQGPYRLPGASGETYIIVLAGSEKIYMDGRLLERGQENDYIIDYNSAEITFTPNQPITKDKRIVAEYQYSDKNYTRYFAFSGNELKTQNGQYWINVYSENDSKNQPLYQDLTEDNKQLLSQIGDSLNQAVAYNIDSVSFENDEVRYKKIDTIVGSTEYTIYKQSNNPDSAFYRIGFSYVGENKGNYIPERSLANGKVYKWVAPVSGIPQGNYEPITRLVTPKKKQLLTFGGENQLTNFTRSFFEIAMSNEDLNTYSTKGHNDDKGYALKLNVDQQIPMNNEDNELVASAGYRFINRNFSPIERFRQVEFERDWNLDDNANNQDEHMMNVGVNFYNENIGTSSLNFDYMNRQTNYKGIKNTLTTNMHKNGFNLDFSGSYLQSDDPINKTNFYRHYGTFSKSFPFIVIGIKDEIEDNKWYQRSSDSLHGNSFYYHQYGLFARTPDTFKTQYFAEYNERKDFLPYNNEMVYSTLGKNYSAGFNMLNNSNNTLKAKATYRRLEVVNDSVNNDQEVENSTTGRIEHALRLWKGAVATSTYYEVGSGLEIKKEYSFLEVSSGQGVYAWTDYNNNGIKELDEFEVAKFQDQANYIRIFTPTNDYVKTYANQLNQTVSLRPDKLWDDEDGIKNFIARFSNLFAYRVKRKNTRGRIIDSFNPFSKKNSDTSLMSINSSIRNTLSFNKLNSKWGMDYIFQSSTNKILLMNGFNTTKQMQNGLQTRWNINGIFILTNEAAFKNKAFISEYFGNKNYDIMEKTNKISLKYQGNSKWLLDMAYDYSNKKNVDNTEQSEGHDIGIEMKYNIIKNGNILFNSHYIHMGYNATPNTPVAYEMLEGLLPGNNYTWSIMFQRILPSGFEINLNYSGRKSQDSKVIHTGNAQVSLNF